MPKKKTKKVRVYELAKDLGIPSNEVVDLLRDEGIEVKSNLSSVTKSEADMIKRMLQGEEEEKPEKKKKKKKEKEKADKKSKVKKEKEEKEPEEEKEKEESKEENVITIGEGISTSELAELLGVPPNRIISICLKLGMQVTINQRLDFETASLIAEEFGYSAKLSEGFETPEIEQERFDVKKKPPVVTVMGHVDHGKTTLLDYIRKTRVASQESGGITQKIGAYHLEYSGHEITFIDTPGHEAFTAMRARGANITDIVVLVVAANEGVKPQTVEAIDHAKAAGAPIVVALNKMDLPSADPNRVLSELAEHDIIVQEFGGETLAVKISALKGEKIDELLDAIILQSEDMELEAPSKGPAKGVILETRMRKGLGNVATVVIKEGEVECGDSFIAGSTCGKVRLLMDENDKRLKKAGPSSAVQISQFDDLPETGDIFRVVTDQKRARNLSEKRKTSERERELGKKQSVSLSNLYEQIEEGDKEILKVVIKGGDAGSVEALSDSLEGLSTDEVNISVIHSGVGPITQNDVMLASASDAVIIGFKSHPYSKAREEAKRRGVEIKTYDVIFEIIEDVKLAMLGMLEPEREEIKCGEVEIREVFRGSSIGTIAGCYVLSGEVHNKDTAIVIRDGKEIERTKISNLKRFENDVKMVEEGYECGIKLKDFEQFEEGDKLEVYKVIEKERKI